MHIQTRITTTTSTLLRCTISSKECNDHTARARSITITRCVGRRCGRSTSSRFVMLHPPPQAPLWLIRFHRQNAKARRRAISPTPASVWQRHLRSICSSSTHAREIRCLRHRRRLRRHRGLHISYPGSAALFACTLGPVFCIARELFSGNWLTLFISIVSCLLPRAPSITFHLSLGRQPKTTYDCLQ